MSSQFSDVQATAEAKTTSKYPLIGLAIVFAHVRQMLDNNPHLFSVLLHGLPTFDNTD